MVPKGGGGGGGGPIKFRVKLTVSPTAKLTIVALVFVVLEALNPPAFTALQPAEAKAAPLVPATSPSAKIAAAVERNGQFLSRTATERPLKRTAPPSA
jgi:hypothetical protein